MFEYYRVKSLAFKERRLQSRMRRALIRFLKARFHNNSILFGNPLPLLWDAEAKNFYTISGIKVENGRLFVLTTDWFDTKSLGIINYLDIIDLL